MSRQRLMSLWWALLLAWLTVASSQGLEHSELKINVFSNLQAESSGQSFPPYPEGIQLELTCQAAAYKTYWFERRPPNEYPDIDKDRLPTSSSSPVPGVDISVYTIPSLGRGDDGRELWCTMDGSSLKKVVKLDVVGPISAVTIRPFKSSDDGWELACSSDYMHSQLKLCWYRGEDMLRCQGSGRGQTTTVRLSCRDVRKQKQGAVLQCRPRLNNQRAMALLMKVARDRFNEIFTNVTKTFTMGLHDINRCKEIRKPTKPTTLVLTATSALHPTNETDRTKTTNPSNETTSTITTTRLPSTTVTTFTVRHSSATTRSTSENEPWEPTTMQLLMIMTAGLMFCIVFTSITCVILLVKLRRTRASVPDVYTDSQGAPNRNQSGNVPPGHNLGASSQSEPEVEEYPGVVDTSDHRWPREGVPLGHAYYYPDITEQVKENILNDNHILASGSSRSGSDRTVASTQPCTAINHSYNYPVLTEEMKRLISVTSVHNSHGIARGGGGGGSR